MKEFFKKNSWIIFVWLITIGILYLPIWKGDYILSPTNFMYIVRPWNVYGVEVTGPSLTDPIDSHLPEIFRKFYQGDMSFWNTYNAFGYPESYNYFLNPVNYVYFLPLRYAILLNSLIKYSVAYFGMCFFLRRLKMKEVTQTIGGVSYSLSSALVMWHYWAHTDVTMWLPVLFAIGYRLMEEWRVSDIFKLSLVVYMMCVAGMPAFAAYSFYLFVPYIVVTTIVHYKDFKKVFLTGIRFVASFVLGIIASAAYVYYVYRMAVKNGYLESRGGLSTVTMEKTYIKSYLLPYYRDGLGLNIIESCSYFGIVALVLIPLAVIGIKRKKEVFWCVALGLCMIFAYTHWLDVLYTHIPAISTSLKIRVINLVPFLAITLAMIQLDDIIRLPERYLGSEGSGRIPVYIKGLVRRLPVYVIITLGFIWFSFRVTRDRSLFEVLIIAAFTYISAELLIAFHKNKIVRNVIYLLLTAVVVYNMISFAAPRSPLVRRGVDVIPEPTESISYIQENGSFRIYTYNNWSMFPNANAYYGIRSIEAHGLINTNRDIRSYLTRVDDKVYASATDTRGSKVDNFSLLQYAGVDIIAGSEELTNVDGSDYKEVLASVDGMTLYQTDRYAPRFYLASSLTYLDTSKQVMDKLMEGYIPGAVYTDDPTLKELTYAEGTTGTVEVLKDEDDDITLRTDSSSAGLLTFNEYHTEDWTVFIDGEESDVHKVNYLVNGVYLDAGEHEVRFVYKAYHQVTFLIVTAISVAILFILSVVFTIIEKKGGSPIVEEIEDETHNSDSLL